MPGYDLAEISDSISFRCNGLRAHTATSYPAERNFSAMALPIPLEAAVITSFFKMGNLLYFCKISIPTPV